MTTRQNVKSCKWDPESNTLTCKERDGTWKRYGISGSILSMESKQIKDTKIDEMIKIGKRCFDTGACKDPVKITMFKLDSCPACAAHDPVIHGVGKKLSDAGIPVNVSSVDARDHLDEFKAMKCNATPCVTMQVGGKKGRKIYEGTRAEIGVISEILGISNPLFTDIRKAKPRRLIA